MRGAGQCTIPRMTMNRTYKIGQSRDQASFLPPCLEDYVSRDNPVRAIDAYVDSLDLNELGFREVGSDGGAGQPPYDPADLLRLYLYGYLHPSLDLPHLSTARTLSGRQGRAARDRTLGG